MGQDRIEDRAAAADDARLPWIVPVLRREDVRGAEESGSFVFVDLKKLS